MTEFADEIKQLAESLSDEAKELVRFVVTREHKGRFGNRDQLPEDYARKALNIASDQEE